MRMWILAAGLVTVVGAQAVAAAPKSTPPPQISAVVSCRAVANAEERLRCYDQAATLLDNAVQQGEVVAVGGDEIRKTRRQLFGFSLPRISLFGGNDDSEEARELNATITSARSLGYGKWLLTLDDGARWQTTEAIVRGEPRSGQKIRIKRAALGGYMLSIENGRSVRAARVQ